MKTDIEIVAGFLGSGKTTFIESLIKNTLIPEEKIVVIQCEEGDRKLNIQDKSGGQIVIKQIQNNIEDEYLKAIVEKYKPHRIIIENNGTREIEHLIGSIYKEDLRNEFTVSSIFSLVDGVTFEMLLNNMYNFIAPPIINSDLIVVHNLKSLSNEEAKKVEKRIEELSSNGYILKLDNINLLDEKLKELNILDKGFSKKMRFFFKKLRK